MSTNTIHKLIISGSGKFCLLATVLTAVLLSSVPALSFEFKSGELSGNFDTTLSYGVTWRVQSQDQDIIGLKNGGNAYSVNGDDGDLNYDDGDLISNAVKVTSDLALQYKNFGVFLRGTAFYDFENNDGDRARTPLSDEALDMVGKDAELLDAYASWDFNVAEMPAQIRAGDQVISWGESTFIRNSINAINPSDASKFRLPGAEIKEALIPVGIVSASISPTENLTLEGFYQYKWEETVIDPPGSYWSTNDFAGEGGQKLLLGFGAAPDFEDAAAVDTFLAVSRSQTREADDDGQYGLAMRVFAPGLNNTEFGFYYMNYHSRVPVISATTGSLAGAIGFGAIYGTDGTDGQGADVADAAIAAYDPEAPSAAILAAIVTGATQDVPMTATQSASIAQTVLQGGSLASASGNSATDYYAKTARYYTEYPEDIQLFGVSFNTQVESTGTALQGEVSYRKDTPLLVDDIELLFATMSPVRPDLAALNQVGNFRGQFEKDIQGYILKDVTQAQMTATQLFGPTFGASQFVLVGELGVTHVLGMPSQDELRLDAPGTPISGNAALAYNHYGEIEPADAFADATSWGYRMVGKLDFNNAIGAVTLSPRIAWAHDVNGNSPGPGGNFIEGRKAITIGLGADYQNTWSADLSYTDFFGAGRYNLLNDRDIVAANIKYSF